LLKRFRIAVNHSLNQSTVGEELRSTKSHEGEMILFIQFRVVSWIVLVGNETLKLKPKLLDDLVLIWQPVLKIAKTVAGQNCYNST
jgi:hypothetical protein